MPTNQYLDWQSFCGVANAAGTALAFASASALLHSRSRQLRQRNPIGSGVFTVNDVLLVAGRSERFFFSISLYIIFFMVLLFPISCWHLAWCERAL